MPKLWKVNCQENRFPGMWQRWYKNQCVAVGWAAKRGYELNGEAKGSRGWSVARNALKKIQIGDYVVVSLRSNRVGRLGQVTRKLIGDAEWNPLVRPSKSFLHGEMGRRVEVRWDLTTGPNDQDLVVQLPSSTRFNVGELISAISEIRSVSLGDLKSEMNNPENWVSLLGDFRYEKALSDYIANYPNRLEEGLLPHPDKKVRERVFKDETRLDVLLVDKQEKTVVVECKQHSPRTDDIEQLRHYMKLFYEEDGEMPRGILVHGGAQKLRSEIAECAKEKPPIEIVNYVLDVRFRPSS